jgi:hypothetical protein
VGYYYPEHLRCWGRNPAIYYLQRTRPHLCVVPCTATALNEPPNITTTILHPTSTRDNSTNMDPIQAAIEAIETCASDEDFSYRKVAAQFNVSRAVLARRHQGSTCSHAGAAQQRQKLNPQQELELVRYIEGLANRGLPPTREMIRNFASAVAKDACSDRWVSQFLERNKAHLTSKWTTRMDRNRHQADFEERYSMYFDLLYQKIQQYNIDTRHIYNMDEKGFLVGITTRSKRVFSKQLWERKEVTEALQDGSREWITLLACICADGSALEPAIIYEGKGALQSLWVDNVEAGKHQVFMATSPSGWTNNELGLAWLEQVFERGTRKKARTSYRLLILDGHGSHLTMDFIEYCDRHRTLLAVFPPHSTHTLQPLDVVMFKPLSSAYSSELSRHLHRSQGLIPIKKGDFFPLFWAAWVTSFTHKNILSSFKATGIAPPNAKVILKRFKTTTSEQDRGLEIEEEGDGSTWRQLRHLFDAAVEDTAAESSRRLGASLHSLQVQNKLLHHENKGLRTALSTQKKHKKKSKPLDLQQRKEYHSGAVFWSPRKVREARVRESVKQQEEEAEKLQKAEAKELKAAATLYKQKIAEERRAQRERERVKIMRA